MWSSTYLSCRMTALVMSASEAHLRPEHPMGSPRKVLAINTIKYHGSVNAVRSLIEGCAVEYKLVRRTRRYSLAVDIEMIDIQSEIQIRAQTKLLSLFGCSVDTVTLFPRERPPGLGCPTEARK